MDETNEIQQTLVKINYLFRLWTEELLFTQEPMPQFAATTSFLHNIAD